MDKVNFFDENVDVVDDVDQIIGSKSRLEVHSKTPLIHREVDILIYDKNRSLLFQQRSRNKNHHPLAWTFGAGGHVKSGETPQQAAEIELFEELGLRGEVTFLQKRYQAQGNNKRFTYFFGYKYDGSPILPNVDEIETIMFVGHKDFDEAMFVENQMAIQIAHDFWAGSFGI